MRFRDKLALEYPECIDISYRGGCEGCPCHYEYEDDTKCEHDCQKCWDREIPVSNRKQLIKC